MTSKSKNNGIWIIKIKSYNKHIVECLQSWEVDEKIWPLPASHNLKDAEQMVKKTKEEGGAEEKRHQIK